MLKHYLGQLKLQFTVGNYVTTPQPLEVGIVTGCTISVILFAAAMNLLVKSAENIKAWISDIVDIIHEIAISGILYI